MVLQFLLETLAKGLETCWLYQPVRGIMLFDVLTDLSCQMFSWVIVVIVYMFKTSTLSNWKLFCKYSRYMPSVSSRRHEGKAFVSPVYLYGQHKIYSPRMVRENMKDNKLQWLLINISQCTCIFTDYRLQYTC